MTPTLPPYAEDTPPVSQASAERCATRLADLRAARALIARYEDWAFGPTARARAPDGPRCAEQAVVDCVPTDLHSSVRMPRIEGLSKILNTITRHLYDRSLVGLNDRGPNGTGREGSSPPDQCYDAVMHVFDATELHLLRVLGMRAEQSGACSRREARLA